MSKQREEDAGAAQLARAVEALCARVDEGRATLNRFLAQDSSPTVRKDHH